MWKTIIYIALFILCIAGACLVGCLIGSSIGADTIDRLNAIIAERDANLRQATESIESIRGSLESIGQGMGDTIKRVENVQGINSKLRIILAGYIEAIKQVSELERTIKQRNRENKKES